MKIRNFLGIFVSVAGILSCDVACVGNNEIALTLIKKPQADQPDIKPLDINKVPETSKEMPFKDTNPEPQPNDMEKNLGFIVFSRPVTEPIFPDTKPLPYEKLKSLEAFATPGEIEPVSFGIYSLKNLKNIRVTASELKSDKSVISRDNIDVRLVTCRNINYPAYTSKDTYRKMPELLEKVTINTIPEKESQRYWIKITVPENTLPGLYKGTVSVSSDEAEKALSIPVFFRVLSFKLIKDPNKHFTAYYYDMNREFDDSRKILKKYAKEYGRDWVEKTAKNEYKAMVDYGFDTYPTIYMNYDAKQKSFYIMGSERSMRDIPAAGMKGPVPAVWADSNSFYKAVTNKEMGKHHVIPEMPPEEFYKALTDAVIKFEQERKAKGWPEFIYVPLDEVDVSAKEFGVKVYKAFKDAGVRTYATKDPKAADAKDYAPYLDFWCSQPFSAPYEEVVSSKTQGYWCYPNHNAYEIKDPLVMCRGGRMTYGFGLWRSGYTLLIPWIWRGYEEDYLRYGSTGGMRLDKDGNVIPAVYWECFREGIDDGKYLYTLETAIVQREDSKDPECQKLVKDGKALLQEIWNSINVQLKYLGNNVWSPEEFASFRWRMAALTEQLLKYPATNNKIAPSVIVDTKKISSKEPGTDFLEKQKASGNIEITDLGADNYKKWKSVCTEGKMTISDKVKRTANNTLLYDVTVDHKNDGGGENGKYPVGWPRIRMDFAGNGLDLTQYDYLSLWIMVDSERDDVADDFSPFYIAIGSNKLRGLYGNDIINAVDQRVWVPVTLRIQDMINSSSSQEAWKSVNCIQFGISEVKYTDGTNLKFYLDNINLIKFKAPAIFALDTPSSILLPDDKLPFSVNIMGTGNIKKGQYIVEASITGDDGKVYSKCSSSELDSNTPMIFDISKLLVGDYKIQLQIKDSAGKVYSSMDKKLKAVKGLLD